MCGRFVLNADGEAIKQKFDLNAIPEIQPRFNIAPTHPIPVITNEKPDELDFYRWGLVPSWAKDIAIGNKMINARSETAHEKPSFRAAYKRRRCLIPATGFYEWAKRDDGKSPFLIHLKDGELFAFAGLWEVWHSPEGDELRTCTILTGEPNDLVKDYHHRMAIILDESAYDAWLSPDELGTDVLRPLLAPYDPQKMAVYQVSKAVNNVANDYPALIEPFTPPQQQALF